MNKKILVTGYLGFVGSYLMKELDTNMYDIETIDLKDGKDILNCELPDKIDIVIHLAALPGVIDSVAKPAENAETNIVGTIRLANKYKDSRFIFASSGGTIQDKIESPYGLSKYCAEEYIKLLCKDYVILRFPNIYGENSRSVVDKFLRQDINYIYGDGSQRRTYGHISDIIRGIIESISWPSQETYKLGGSDNYAIEDIAKLIHKPMCFVEKREGELQYSSLENTGYKWSQRVRLEDYIKERVK